MKLTANEAFEIKAATFHRMTGYLAPGKSVPPGLDSAHYDATRHAKWEVWTNEHRMLLGAMLWAVEDTLAPHD